VEHVARMRLMIIACTILFRKPEIERPLGKPRCRWEDNIKMDTSDIEFGCVDWIHMAQNRERWFLD
jgi:hypothetical protein